MIGTIIGDIAGCPYEGDRLGQDKRDYRPFFLNGLAKFTDDTNLTIAVADAILNGLTFEEAFIKWHTKNPDLGYGSAFKEWAEKGGGYQNESRGNGAAMRVSPIALFAQKLGHTNLAGEWVFETFEDQVAWAMDMAAKSTEPSHNCAEARNGAMAVVMACLLAAQRDGAGNPYPKNEMRDMLTKLTNYDLTASVETIRETWPKRDIRCDITVPQALICFLESTSFEDCIRLSVYSKGDVDTIAAIAGGIAEWYYGLSNINKGILAETKLRLQPEMIAIIEECYGDVLKW